MLARLDVVGAEALWLLEVEVSGRPMYYSERRIEVTRDDGVVLVYEEGLAELTHSVAGSSSPDETISVQLTTEDDWASIVARFHEIVGSPARLSRWFDGQIYESRRLILEGYVSGLSYREQDEPVGLVIKRRSRSQSRMLPSPGMVVDETTWGPVASAAWGFAYPIIIGQPGTYSSGTLPGAPAFYVDTDIVLVAGHTTAATTVTILDTTDLTAPIAEVFALADSVDATGRKTRTADISGAVGLTSGSGRRYFTAWPAAGGLISPFTGELLRGAGDVIEWIIRTWTDIRLDHGRHAAVREALNAYKIDTYIDDPVDPMEWLAGIIDWLPVDQRVGEDGIYYHLRRWGATEADAVLVIDLDAGDFQLESDIAVVGVDQVINEVTVKYAPYAGGELSARRIIGAENSTRPRDEFEPSLVQTDARIIGNHLARLSQARPWGRRPHEIELHDVWDTTTAIQVGMDALQARALPKRALSVSGEVDLETVRDGSIALVNRSSSSLSYAVAEIVDMDIGGPDVLLHLEVLDDPTQRARLAS